MQKIIPFLWFDTEAEQAANFYVSVFKNSKLGKIVWAATSPSPAASALRSTVCFRRVGRTWKIVHEHASVPFCMDGSYRAATDLAP